VEIPLDWTLEAERDRLDDYLAQPLANVYGLPMRITTQAIDSGYLTDDVLAYTRTRRGRGVFAVKGASTYNRPILNRPSKVDINWRGQTMKNGGELWIIGVDTAKHALFSRLAADRKRALPSDRLIHFPAGLDESFYSQLTAEVWDPNQRRWVKVRPRNEALDVWCYALAAAHHPTLRLHTWREPQWAKLEAALEPVGGDLFAQPIAPPRTDAAKTQKPAGPRLPRRVGGPSHW
jgi:phage terminase large subunit GpA-like protein